jgi:hypothetical protein
MTHRVGLFLSVILLAGCREQREEKMGRSTPLIPQIPDSVWVSVTGPTFVAFSPLVSEGALDRDADLATVLDDFGWHLASATDSLRALGYSVEARAGDTLWLRTKARSWYFTPAADSAQVGFYVIRPGAEPAVHYGVLTDIEISELGRRYLGLPE